LSLICNAENIQVSKVKCVQNVEVLRFILKHKSITTIMFYDVNWNIFASNGSDQEVLKGK